MTVRRAPCGFDFLVALLGINIYVVVVYDV